MAAELVRSLLKPEVTIDAVNQLIDNLAAGAGADLNFFNEFLHNNVIRTVYEPPMEARILYAEWEEVVYQFSDTLIREFDFGVSSYKHTEIGTHIWRTRDGPKNAILRDEITTHLVYRDALYELFANCLFQLERPTAVLKIKAVRFDVQKKILYYVYESNTSFLVQDLMSKEVVKPEDFLDKMITVAEHLQFLQERFNFVHRNLNINYILSNGAFIHLRDSMLKYEGRPLLGIGTFNKGKDGLKSQDLYLLLLTFWVQFAKKLSKNSMTVVKDFFSKDSKEKEIQKRFDYPDTISKFRYEHILKNVRMENDHKMLRARPWFFKWFRPANFIENMNRLRARLPANNIVYANANKNKVPENETGSRSANATSANTLNIGPNAPGYVKWPENVKEQPNSNANAEPSVINAAAVAVPVSNNNSGIPSNIRPISKKNALLSRRTPRSPGNNRTQKRAKFNNNVSSSTNSRSTISNNSGSNNGRGNNRGNNNETNNNYFEFEMPQSELNVGGPR